MKLESLHKFRMLQLLGEPESQFHYQLTVCSESEVTSPDSTFVLGSFMLAAFPQCSSRYEQE
jgi:hypothetical protein